MADLTFLSDALSGSGSVATPPPETIPAAAAPDLQFLSESFSQPAPSKRFQLEQELAQARKEREGQELTIGVLSGLERQTGYAADPLGTLFTGLHQAGALAEGGVADIGREVLTKQPTRWENLRAATNPNWEGPLPIERELEQQPGVLPALALGGLRTVRTAPTLAAGAAMTAATGGAAAPYVIYPALFGAQTLAETGDVGQAVKSAAIGAFYPVVGKLVGPVSAGIVNRLGLSGRPLAQKAVETTVDQALMQAATHLVSLPEYATMTPDQREKAFFQNAGSILVFSVPRVLGYAAGAPSEYEGAIREEAGRLQDLFRSQQEEQARTAQRGETAQLIRTVRASSPGRRAAARVAEETMVPAVVPVPPAEVVSPGVEAIRRVLAMPDADAAKLDQKPIHYKGIEFTPEDVPALTAASKESLKRLLEASAAAQKSPEDKALSDANRAEMGRNIWLAGAIEFANKEGPNYRAAMAEKAAAQTTEVPNATDQITEQKSIQQQRVGANAQLQGEGNNRQLTTEEQAKGVEPGAGNILPGAGGVTPEAAPPEAGAPPVAAAPLATPEPLLIRPNRVTDLPEIQLARKDKPTDTVTAWLSYNPRGGQADFLQVRGASSLSSYRIPLSSLPEGSWSKGKQGFTVDKQAVLDFLNDPVKRQQAMSTTGNVKRFHPDDVASLLETEKPVGRPSTGEGTPIGQVTVEPKVLERIAPAAPTAQPEMGAITRAAFDRLLQTNRGLVDTMLRRRPTELDDTFWSGVRDELAKMPEYADDPRKPDALVASLKRLKEEGSELDWYASREGSVAPMPMDLVTAQGAVQKLLGGSVPPNVRFINDPNAPVGHVSFRPGEMPVIDLNLSKHTTTEGLRGTLLEELIHPLQSDPALRQYLRQIEALVTEADLARKSAVGYQMEELLPEAANEIVRKLYGQHAVANVFRRAVNQVTLAIKRLFGLNLTDEQVALHLVNQALKNKRVSSDSIPGERLVAKNAVVTAPGSRPPRAASLTAHHGTPHRVERFTTERIGTGEGAQVYGWGLYFAENPQVSRSYANQLSELGRMSYQEARDYLGSRLTNASSDDIHRFASAGMWPSDAMRVEAIREFARENGADLGDAIGREYTVRLDVKPDEMLDFGKPLNQQSPQVQRSLAPLLEKEVQAQIAAGTRNEFGMTPREFVNSMTGDEVYWALARKLTRERRLLYGHDAIAEMPDAQLASEALLSNGIQGVRYLDQGSLGGIGPVIAHTASSMEDARAWADANGLTDIGRGRNKTWVVWKPGETYNYVIFDESRIHITHENGQEVPVRQAMGEQPQTAKALESPEKVEEYTSPMTHNPERFRMMAQVLNKGLVPPPVISRFEALSPGARGELAKVFPGRIGTYQNQSGEVVAGPTFRQVMTDPARTPEERNDYARHGLAEYVLYQKERQDVHEKLAKTAKELDETVVKSIAATPRTNEAELLATNLMGGILDKIKAEREKTAEGAQTNERIREGIDHIDQLTGLLEQPVALGRAMRGIANQVGRDTLMAAHPGEEALQLISEGTEFPGGVFATPGEWIRALANHLDHLTRSDGTKSILAGRDVIEAALWGLRQVADARESLLEVQMTSDGTLKRFNDDYLADLQSKVPTGFNGILKKYAKAKVESDALSSAFKRLNRRVDTLTERKANLEQATAFLNEHDLNPDFRDFGRAVTQYTGARSMQYTQNGPVIEYEHPLTGDPVRIEHTFDKGETVENIQKLQHLAEAGLDYASRPNADPQKAAFWEDFANQIMDYQLVASPDYGRLEDPLLNPLSIMTKSKYGLIAETALSRIPGALSLETTRAIEAFATAMKVKNEFQKDNEANVLATNMAARDSHEGMSLDRWQKEVASPIIDSRQHFGQTVYHAGDRIAGFGHLITREDIKAVDAQYRFEQTLRRLHERARVPAVVENPATIKEGNIQRLALSRGPGTVTRIIPRSTRDLPAQWRAAVEAEPVEGQTSPVDQFLKSGDNFIRVMLGHVMEEERDYFQLGKGPFARDYKAMREDRQSLEQSGEMPNNLDSLSEWIAEHHNENLREEQPPVTPGDVRKTLIEEVSRYMTKIGEDTLEKANAAKLDIVSHENGFTQPRGGKIAPGTLYQYGIPDRAAMISKGNDAVEFYAIRYRDALKKVQEALLKERERLGKAMEEIYGGQGVGSRRKLDKGIEAGNNPRLQDFQMTTGEVDRNISRVGKLLNNMQDILKNREAFFGDDIANRLYSPWLGASVGSVLMRPKTWMVNGASGSVMWAMKTAELRRGGWLTAPTTVLKTHITHFMNTVRLKFTPRNAKERAIKQFLDDNPELTTGTADFVTAILREAADREALRRLGVIDSFSTRDYLGWDSERPVMQNLKAAIDTMRNVTSRPDTSALKSIFSYMGIIPRSWQIATRKIGMRWADNWINGQSTQFSRGLVEQMRVQAIKSFDGRLKNDPAFKQLYEQYGDNFQRFALALTGRGTGELLTPGEITGRFDPLTRDKAAIQLRRTFIRNGESADLLMLKYWWNKRSAQGDKSAPFMTDAQRYGLMFSLVEDVNLGTLASRSTYFAGSRERQWLGVLSQYWLWVTDRLADLAAKPQGQRTLGVRYTPAIVGFLLTSAIAALVSNTAGQKANDALFNTVSQKPSFWDATTDAQRAKILMSNTASYWGAMGSLVSLFMDSPGKLGYRNPVFLANVLTDLLNVGVSGYQSGDYAGPAMNFLAKYNPAAQAVINRLPSREGLLEVRNAANNLRAATPDTLEAKRRQPSSGSDFRSTPMTPLYNAILNAAVEKNWGQVDELWTKAVEQGKAMGIPNPESAILSAIRTRSPESAVFQRVLTPEERDMVYNRMTPEARAQVEATNAVFDELAAKYGRGGGAGGALGGSIAALPKPALAGVASIGGALPGGGVGVRRGFRTRSLMRRTSRSVSLRGRRVRSIRARLPRIR